MTRERKPQSGGFVSNYGSCPACPQNWKPGKWNCGPLSLDTPESLILESDAPTPRVRPLRSRFHRIQLEIVRIAEEPSFDRQRNLSGIVYWLFTFFVLLYPVQDNAVGWRALSPCIGKVWGTPKQKDIRFQMKIRSKPQIAHLRMLALPSGAFGYAPGEAALPKLTPSLQSRRLSLGWQRL